LQIETASKAQKDKIKLDHEMDEEMSEQLKQENKEF